MSCEVSNTSQLLLYDFFPFSNNNKLKNTKPRRGDGVRKVKINAYYYEFLYFYNPTVHPLAQSGVSVPLPAPVALLSRV